MRSEMVTVRSLLTVGYIVIGAGYIWASEIMLSAELASSLGVTEARLEMAGWLGFVVISALAFLLVSRQFDRRHLKNYRELLRARNHIHDLQHYERLGKIAGGLSDDLRNFLKVLELHISTLRGHAQVQGEVAGHAEKLRTQANRLLDMSDALTEAFVSEERRDNGEPVRLDEFLYRELDLVRPLHRGGQLVFRQNSDVAELDVDRLHLHRLTLNLLQNAASAADEGDTVELELTEGGDGNVHLTVSHTGESMPREVMQSFNGKFRLAPMRDSHGWGVEIIRNAVREMGASLEAEPRARKEGGARIRISFGAGRDA